MLEQLYERVIIIIIVVIIYPSFFIFLQFDLFNFQLQGTFNFTFVSGVQHCD